MLWKLSESSHFACIVKFFLLQEEKKLEKAQCARVLARAFDQARTKLDPNLFQDYTGAILKEFFEQVKVDDAVNFSVDSEYYQVLKGKLRYVS